nr:uncharacterized protein LOC101233722 isoform X1 [Taeniopygia guttata]
MAMTPIREGGMLEGRMLAGAAGALPAPYSCSKGLAQSEDKDQAGKTAGIVDESNGAAILERGARGDAAPVGAQPAQREARGRWPGPRECHPCRKQKPSS